MMFVTTRGTAKLVPLGGDESSPHQRLVPGSVRIWQRPQEDHDDQNIAAKRPPSPKAKCQGGGPVDPKRRYVRVGKEAKHSTGLENEAPVWRS